MTYRTYTDSYGNIFVFDFDYVMRVVQTDSATEFVFTDILAYPNANMQGNTKTEPVWDLTFKNLRAIFEATDSKVLKTIIR